MRAYLDVIPNFWFSGRWWSKSRFVVLMEGGSLRRFLAKRLFRDGVETYEEVQRPGALKDAFDVVDWDVLQAAYDKRRKRYYSKGHYGPWIGTALDGEGLGVVRQKSPDWKGPAKL